MDLRLASVRQGFASRLRTSQNHFNSRCCTTSTDNTDLSQHKALSPPKPLFPSLKVYFLSNFWYIARQGPSKCRRLTLQGHSNGLDVNRLASLGTTQTTSLEWKIIPGNGYMPRNMQNQRRAGQAGKGSVLMRASPRLSAQGWAPLSAPWAIPSS